MSVKDFFTYIYYIAINIMYSNTLFLDRLSDRCVSRNVLPLRIKLYNNKYLYVYTSYYYIRVDILAVFRNIMINLNFVGGGGAPPTDRN